VLLLGPCFLVRRCSWGLGVESATQNSLAERAKPVYRGQACETGARRPSDLLGSTTTNCSKTGDSGGTHVHRRHYGVEGEGAGPAARQQFPAPPKQLSSGMNWCAWSGARINLPQWAVNKALLECGLGNRRQLAPGFL